MSPIKKVFLIIALLVLAFLLWQVVFNDGGMLQTAYNAVVGVINKTWQTITGGTTKILPQWGDVNNGNGNGLSNAEF